jgi:hypothetical protein
MAITSSHGMKQFFSQSEGHQMWHRSAFAPVILLAISLFPGCSGQRFIEVNIERDGAPALHTAYGVSDSLSPAGVWGTLEGQSFTAASTITPEREDPKKAVLKGRIRIVITHVKNELAASKISELRLVRDSDSDDQWKLASGEVKRTSQAAGL